MYWLVLLRLITVAEAQIQNDIKAIFGLANQSQKVTPIKHTTLTGTSATYCGAVPTSCVESYYRSYDGSCNNLEHSWWSTPYTPYKRLLRNSYSDGISKFPKSILNEDLPNPRACSLTLYSDIPKPDILWNIAFMQYGQIIAHDMSLTAGVSQANAGGVVCCSKGELTLAAETDPRCAPIPIPEDDPYNIPEGITCMDFYRTESTKDGRNCVDATEVAEPLTSITGVLDVSFIYGSDKTTAMNMRAGIGGKLKSVKRKGRELLTQDPDPTMTCDVTDPREPCYYAGDVRVNQNPQLALLHNLYLAQHNSIADALAEVNPQWDDETLYQETRRIVIAKQQYVTYYEFLPPLIGRINMIENKLIYPDATGFVNDYDPTVNPAVSIEFASAAYRFFHTEIVGSILSYKQDRIVSNLVQLSDWMNRPSVCEHANNFNGLTIGMATQAQSADDTFMSSDILNYLFKNTVNGKIGLDLKAIDIQRARDHGCGTYVQALRYFGLSNPQSFADFVKFIPPTSVAKLESLYVSYLDVDLSVGLSLEYILPEALCGVTAQAILTEQFGRTRRGDYFFYENGNGKYPFTLEQLYEIRKSTVASFLCYNPEVELMQVEAFKLLSPLNPLKSCRDIPSFNATAWKGLSWANSN